MDKIEVTQAVAERFWSRVNKRGPDECWEWLGGKGSGTANGRYGRMSISHAKSRPAHQVSWEIANGAPFPKGMNGCHSCDNPGCVNPSHIWPGTQSDNIKDAVAKGRHSSKPKTECAKGHRMENDNRIPVKGGGSRCRQCARVGTRERMRKMRARRQSHV